MSSRGDAARRRAEVIKQATTTPDYPASRSTLTTASAGRMRCSTRPCRWTSTGSPLKETLRLCLKQLGLAYEVKEGLLRITSEDEFLVPDLVDPFPIVGHCLLALLVAGFGGGGAPMVAQRSLIGFVIRAHLTPRSPPCGRPASSRSAA